MKINDKLKQTIKQTMEVGGCLSKFGRSKTAPDLATMLWGCHHEPNRQTMEFLAQNGVAAGCLDSQNGVFVVEVSKKHPCWIGSQKCFDSHPKNT